MKLLFLIVSVLVFGEILCSPLDQICNRGPSYWCSTLTAAAECKAIKHCIQTVWTKKIITDENSNGKTCNLCKTFVIEARYKLKHENFPIDALIATCDLLPESEIKNKCNHFIENLIPDLFEILKSEISPQIFCSITEMCNQSDDESEELTNDDVMIEEHFKMIEKGVKNRNFPCTICRIFFNQIHWFLNSPQNKLKVIEFFKSVCTVVPIDFHLFCEQNIRLYGEMIFTLITPYINSKLCNYTPICSAFELSLNETNLLNDENIKSVIDDEISAINSKEPTVKLNDSPECDSTHWCDTNTSDEKIDTNDSNEGETDLSNETDDSSIDNNENDVEKFRPGCSLCKSAIRQFQREMSHKTSDEIRRNVGRICNVFGMFKHYCTKFINKNQRKFIQQIMNKINEKQICKQIRLCSISPADDNSLEEYSEDDPKLETQIEEANDLESDVGWFHPGCNMCKNSIRQVEIQMRHQNRGQIKRVVLHICDGFGFFQHLCRLFLNQHQDQFIDFIARQISPDTVCRNIRLCSIPKAEYLKQLQDRSLYLTDDDFSTSNNVDFPINNNNEVNFKIPGLCVMCLKVIKRIESLIVDKKSAMEIKEVLMHSCDNFFILKQLCLKFTTKYSDKIVQLVMSTTNPEEVCRKMFVCLAQENYYY